MSATVPGDIPLADISLLRAAGRRTRTLRLALGCGILALVLAAAVLSGRQRTAATPYLPDGSNGIVVLDVSASISSETYARIGTTLDALARSDGRYGLVLFSDTAYEALPPGTPARELRAFQLFFVLPARRPGFQPALPVSPWTESFSAGTRISSGLQLALDRIRDLRLGRPSVLLVSDLDNDAGDNERLTGVAIALRRLDVPVRVVGLNPAPEDQRLVERLLPSPGHLVHARLPGEERVSLDAGFPLLLAGACVAAAALLALYERLATPLRWGDPS